MKENIWGKEGCGLPSGELCNACCILPEIELEGNIISLKKPEFTPCPNLSTDGQGCKFHFTGDKPSICARWHCSQASLTHKMELISQAISSQIVNEIEANVAIMRLLDGESTGTKALYIIEEVHNYANDLKDKTMIRKLVPGDLDEP